MSQTVQEQIDELVRQMHQAETDYQIEQIEKKLRVLKRLQT